MEEEPHSLFEQKAEETLISLDIGNKTFLCSPMYGQSCILCCCFRKLEFMDSSKFMRDNLKRHLKVYKCYEFVDIETYFDAFITQIKARKKPSTLCVPLKLENVFELPDRIREIGGYLCLACHKLQSTISHRKCCQNSSKVDVKMYGQRKVKRNASYLLKSIEFDSPLVKKYLKEAYGMKDFEVQIKQLENEIECHQTTIAELRHETTMLKAKVAHLTTDADFSTDHYIGPNLEEISKLIESGSNIFKNCSNPNEILSDKDFIMSVLNFEKSITKAELFEMHKLPRGKLSTEENELEKVSIIMMKTLNGKVDKSKGTVAARITVIGARTIDSTPPHFNSVTAKTVVKYNQAVARPLLVYLYRTDNQFKEEIRDVIINWKDKDLTEYTPRLIKAVLWNLIRILKNHSSLNPLFKFLQAMSIVSTSKYNGIEADVDEENQDEEYPHHSQEGDANSETDITYCRSTTLNTLLSALKFFCFGCVLLNWNELSPLDSYLQHFKDGLIFSQISTLLYQVQRKQDVKSNEQGIQTKFDEELQIYKYICLNGDISVTKFQTA